MSLMRPKNEVESTLSAAFTRGSSTTIDLDDASDFPDSGVVRIDDGSEWCLLKYSGKSTNSLTGLSDAEAVNVSPGSATYTWPVGTTVTLVQASDYLNAIVDVLTGNSPLEGDLDYAGHNILSAGKLNFNNATTLTISSGAITITQSVHYVDTEGGTSTDDIDTINGGSEGDLLYLRVAAPSRTVVIKHGTGNIVTPDGNDYSLDSTDKVVALLFDGTDWHLLFSTGFNNSDKVLALYVEGGKLIKKAFSSIQAAIDALPSSGGTVIIGEGTYTLSSGLIGKSKLHLIGMGPEKTIIDGSGLPTSAKLLSISGSTSDGKSLTADANKGDTSLTVAAGDESSFSAGDIVLIRSDEVFGNGKCGELQEVSGTASGTIYLTGPLFDDYPTSQNAVVEKVSPVQDIKIEGIKWIGGGAGSSHWGINIDYGHNIRIENCWFVDLEERSIMLNNTFYAIIRGNKIQRSNKSGLGYGVSITNASREIHVESNTFEQCRHAITCGGNDSGGVPRFLYYVDNTAMYCTHNAYDTHPLGEFVVIRGNTAIGCKGIIPRCPHVLVEGNVLDGLGIANGGIDFRYAKAGTVIQNNIIRGYTYGITNIDYYVSDGQVKISGNTITNVNYGIYAWNAKDLEICHNVIDASSVGIYLRHKDQTMTDNIVVGNHIRNASYGIILASQVDYTIVTNNILRNCSTPISGDGGPNGITANNIT